MPIATGFIKSVEGATNRFTSSFTINGVQYKLDGIFAGPIGVPEFTCHKATLSYDNVGQLTGSVLFSARIGPSDITLTLDFGVIIIGTFDKPIDRKVVASGVASWS